MIDLIKPSARRVDELVEKTRNSVESWLNLEAKMSSRPEKVYPTYEEALARLIESSTFMHGKDNVTEVSAGIMLQRGAGQVNMPVWCTFEDCHQVEVRPIQIP